MIRRRGHQEEEESSSDEEDAFSALSKKGNAKKKAKTSAPSSNPTNDNVPNTKSSQETKSTPKAASQLPSGAPISITSSMKRHHKPSDARKAKMDALIQELEAEKDQIPKKSKRFVPEKKGSFVAPGEEHLTTNLFVGNLAPSIAEEVNSLCSVQFADVRFFFQHQVSSVEFLHPSTFRILATFFRSLVRSI